MGLDACVYCDCVEKGNLRTRFPYPELLYIEPDGSLGLRSDNPAVMGEYYSWLDSDPCSHEQFILMGHRLGNASGIAWIRWVVRQVSVEPGDEFPILWSQVIYSGIHAGDFLTPAEAVQLGAELQRLKASDVKTYIEENPVYFGNFLENMQELVEASRLVGKPISF